MKERLRAGFKYFFMTHVATALMFLGAIIIYTHSKSFAFSDIGSTMSAMAITNPGSLHLALAFFFIGFATKAGILPFGDWLPDAYPSAPSPAAATFGGIMSKLGIYGLIRIFFKIFRYPFYCLPYFFSFGHNLRHTLHLLFKGIVEICMSPCGSMVTVPALSNRAQGLSNRCLHDC